MVQILNKIRILWLEKLVKRHHTKYDFFQNFLPIKLAHLEEIKKNKITAIEKVANLKVTTLEIKAGVITEFIRTQRDLELETLNSKFYWRNRAAKQTMIRKGIQSNESLELLKKKHEDLSNKIVNRWTNPSPQEADKQNLENQKKIITNARDIKIANQTKKHEEKYASTIKRVELVIEKHKRRHEILQNRLTKIEKQETSTLDKGVILKLDNLSMHFGGLKAVDQLSFEVKEGEIFGLIGPNGAGKTTVFNCITRFYRPTKGDMYFKNNLGEVVHLNDIVVHNIIKHGIVRTFQNVEMVWELNVIDNLLVAAHTEYMSGFFGHMFNSRLLRQEDLVLRKKAEKILADLELSTYALAYPYGLPYGILKKIELARTLMVNPKLIILDEPAAGLNDAETENLAETIRKIKDEYKTTIFLVEHDMGLVMNICDTVCAISFGKKLAIGTPKDIQNDKLVREAYLGGE